MLHFSIFFRATVTWCRFALRRCYSTVESRSGAVGFCVVGVVVDLIVEQIARRVVAPPVDLVGNHAIACIEGQLRLHGRGVAGSVGILRPAIPVPVVGPAQREAMVRASGGRAAGQPIHVFHVVVFINCNAIQLEELRPSLSPRSAVMRPK